MIIISSNKTNRLASNSSVSGPNPPTLSLTATKKFKTTNQQQAKVNIKEIIKSDTVIPTPQTVPGILTIEDIQSMTGTGIKKYD